MRVYLTDPIPRIFRLFVASLAITYSSKLVSFVIQLFFFFSFTAKDFFLGYFPRSIITGSFNTNGINCDPSGIVNRLHMSEEVKHFLHLPRQEYWTIPIGRLSFWESGIHTNRINCETCSFCHDSKTFASKYVNVA